MARGRMISKSLSTSQRFASLATIAGDLAEFAQVLFPLVLSHSDDFGRLQGDPFTVKHQCHPTSPRSLEEFAQALRHLHEVGLIVWFATNGRHYIQICNFEKHQQGLHKRTRSAFPRIPEEAETPDFIGSDTFRESPGQLKGTQENLTKENRSTDIAARYAVFASEYPAERRVGGQKAKVAFAKAFDGQADLEAHFQRMMTALRQHKRSRQWNGPEPKIPLMTTWLNQERWNQVLPETRQFGDGGRVPGCRHLPPCIDAAAHTKREIDERKKGVA